MIAVIAHHKSGGEVQCRCKGDGVWIRECHLDARGFNFADFDYRAKPEPMVIYAEVTYVGVMPNRRVVRYSNSVITPKHGGTVVKFVEVTE
jgi:hypothetical protein